MRYRGLKFFVKQVKRLHLLQKTYLLSKQQSKPLYCFTKVHFERTFERFDHCNENNHKLDIIGYYFNFLKPNYQHENVRSEDQSSFISSISSA